MAGWLEPGGVRPAAQLDGLAEALRHRGPDDRDTLVKADVGLAFAHNRLSIIDLSAAGRQPMLADDGVALIFNGEIYNFQELRRQLEGAGFTFRSRTDSEVVLHGYRHWGAAVVERLAGMFAFAIWDPAAQRLFLARDPLGIKPLYYWRGARGVVFASELKAFLTLPDFAPRASAIAVRQFLEFDFILDRHQTALEGVQKLPPGHTLTFTRAQLEAGQPVAPRAFFEPAAALAPMEPADIDARSDALFELLNEVVGQHLVADVPVALLLSGGLDSSVLAALAARRGPLRTISMAFAEAAFDERPFARAVSAHVGSAHEEVVLRSEDLMRDLPAAVRDVDDLHGDWGVISTRLLYERCRQAGAKVVLVGEGSDEVFGGYPQFEAQGPRWRRGVGLYHVHASRRFGRGLANFLALFRAIDREAGGDPFNTVRLFEVRHQLPQRYNMKVDKASMAASVEARVPYLDVRVAKQALGTPRGALLSGGANKLLLRHMAERHSLLPRELARRPKFGGSIAASWMDNLPNFRAFARDVVLDSGGWARALGLGRAMEDYFVRGRQTYPFPHPLSILSTVAWRLLMLQLWSRHYLPGVRAGL